MAFVVAVRRRSLLMPAFVLSFSSCAVVALPLCLLCASSFFRVSSLFPSFYSLSSSFFCPFLLLRLSPCVSLVSFLPCASLPLALFSIPLSLFGAVPRTSSTLRSVRLASSVFLLPTAPCICYCSAVSPPRPLSFVSASSYRLPLPSVAILSS